MIGSSSFIKPYHTHNESPEIRTSSITKEISSTFFSLITLINCGIIEMEVRTPAVIPKMFSFINVKSFFK